MCQCIVEYCIKMKTIVIGDIHNYVDNIEGLLASIPHDQVIFLGDYFDNFGDSPFVAQKTAAWLLQSLQHENRIHLMGNHDMPYRYVGNIYMDCPGFTNKKSKVINATMSLVENSWSKLKFAHFDHENSVIFSHAGLTEKLFPCHPINGPNLKEMEEAIINAGKEMDKNSQSMQPLFCENIDPTYCGITWIRPNYFKMIPGITQVVGHTPTSILQNGLYNSGTPILRKQDGGAVWYMDCAHTWIGIYEDGELTPINRWTKEPLRSQGLDD
jgi:predicted phosphodiesterase